MIKREAQIPADELAARHRLILALLANMRDSLTIIEDQLTLPLGTARAREEREIEERDAKSS